LEFQGAGFGEADKVVEALSVGRNQLCLAGRKLSLTPLVNVFSLDFVS